ncbi:MAG: F0F1 ATP synthase subunit delta [Dehalococcoidia bacterium]|nr:F0F1 ATP synthase subunit delta [Dehalococcoidia bacterium]
MARRPTAKRYALAAFQIARESGQLESWAKDLGAAQQALQNPALRAYLELPKIRIEHKIETLRTALAGVNPLALNLMSLLTSRASVGLLPRIVDEYQRLMDAHLNRERAEVATAIPLEQEQSNRFTQQLRQFLGKDVILTSRVDPEVLGGLVARVGDRIIDGSARGRLMALRKSLSEARG